MEDEVQGFLRFVRPHWRALHLLARRYCAREHDAQDLVQETLLRASRGFDSAAREATFTRAWLLVIMRNVTIDWQRTARRRIRFELVSDSELTEVAAPDPAEPLCPLPTLDEDRFREFLDDKVVAALDAIDPAYREVLILAVAGDLTYREIGEVLDCPVGTVMSRMARARRGLRERLSEFARATGWVTENRP